jgi:hypothetical protein
VSVNELRAMAFPSKIIEQIILGLSNPLNRHLVKLIAFLHNGEDVLDLIPE